MQIEEQIQNNRFTGKLTPFTGQNLFRFEMVFPMIFFVFFGSFSLVMKSAFVDL